jgi:dihydroflavonol-4-reductase
MTKDAASGERILLVSGGPPQSFLSVATILRDSLGEAASQVTTDEYSEQEVRHLAETVPALRAALTQLGKRPQVSNAKAMSILGWTPRPVAETIRDTAQSLIERGLV